MPNPIADNLGVGPETFSREYGLFLDEMMKYVKHEDLSEEVRKSIRDLEVDRDNLDRKLHGEGEELGEIEKHFAKWARYCAATNTSPGNMTVYAQWAYSYGGMSAIDRLRSQKELIEGRILHLLSREYAGPDEKDAFEIYSAFNNPGSRFRFPNFPDKEYTQQLTPEVLASLPLGNTALFIDRHLTLPEFSIEDIGRIENGAFREKIRAETQARDSIERDWGGFS